MSKLEIVEDVLIVVFAVVILVVFGILANLR